MYVLFNFALFGETLYLQDVCETVGSIPVHIGVADLKLLGVMAVEHRYMKWTNGLNLSVDDVELRSTTWEEYIPKGDGYRDVDAIADWYFKVNRGKKRFDAGAKVLELALALPNEKYEFALAHSQGSEDEPVQVCVPC